ncbi:MAG: hypothetical protein ACM30G_09190 [Micromonosporaceae bacterium]
MIAKKAGFAGLRWLTGCLVVALVAVFGAPTPASAVVTLNLWGPSSITTPGNYTYTAQFGVPYASFQWFVRACATDTVESCSGTWNQQYDATFYYPDRSELTRQLTIDCTPETSSFQVKVIGSGFATPPQTKYKVTLLCYEKPPL